MHCKTCHYSLSGLTEHRCPECGNAFDPNDPSTFDDPNSGRIMENELLAFFVWLIGIASSIALPSIGLFLAGGGHGWITCIGAGFVAWLLVPLTIITWHLRRTATALPIFTIVLILCADAWVVWNVVWSNDAEYFSKAFRGMPVLVIIWFVAWFGWQLLLLPIAGQLRARLRRA